MLLRFVHNKDEQLKILHACHVDSTSGHLSKTRTTHRIKEHFMWHGMVKVVQTMVSSADLLCNNVIRCAEDMLYSIFISAYRLRPVTICQRMNRKMTTGAPELHPIPVVSPWYHVGTDLVGPISPTASDGSQYIVTLISQSGLRPSPPKTRLPAQLLTCSSRYCSVVTTFPYDTYTRMPISFPVVRSYTTSD